LVDFILRYYYFLKDDIVQTESLVNVFKQKSLSVINSSSVPDFSEPVGFFFNLTDASGKMNILGIKAPADAGSWVDAWKLLQDWETKAGVCSEDLMGKLTVLVTATGKLSDLLKATASLLACCEVQGEYPSDSKFFRLPIDKKDNEAIYVYAPAGPETMSDLLLIRRLPIFHGRIIYLYELDSVLLDRHDSIRREKEELEKDLIRIFHTKLIMNQSSLTLNEELERDIEGLATAFAKLVGDKRLISDGIKRLESMLERIEKQYLKEQAFQIDSDSVSKMLAAYHERVEDLRLTYDDLSLAENNHQAAIEVVQSKIQVMNSRTNMATQEKIRDLLNVNIDMQRKSLVFQYAAGLIEFIILAYYSLYLWSYFTPIAAEIIPSWIQVIFLFVFSGNTVLITHYLAEYMQGSTHVPKKLIIASISLAIIIASIILGTLIVQRH
jgi:hypothetical protein